ncbi:MAG TPA: fibronectin type III domain-containing protein [Verrucomicrobiae bacterium]
MKKITRVALNFATYTNVQLNNFAILAIVCLKNNALFPNLPVAIAALTALQTAFQDAMTAAGQGGIGTAAAQQEAREALVSALRQTAAYITSLVPTLTLSQILSSGFDVVNTNTTPYPLTQPGFTLDNSTSGQLFVYLQAVTNAKAYQLQYSGSDGAWQEAGIYPNTKGIVLANLTSGTIYNARIRAVGGSTQYSEWSATVSMMAT